MAPVMADVLAARGTRALVFRGDDGLDELTTTTTSAVWRVLDGQVLTERLDPAAVGLPPCDPEALRGGDAATNAAVARDFLAGARGPVRDTVLLNAAAALVALHDGAGALPEQLGVRIAELGAAVDDGRAAAALDRWVEASQAAAG
jgi:anthranilate phosphoribosyltransferase